MAEYAEANASLRQLNEERLARRRQLASEGENAYDHDQSSNSEKVTSKHMQQTCSEFGSGDGAAPTITFPVLDVVKQAWFGGRRDHISIVCSSSCTIAATTRASFFGPRKRHWSCSACLGTAAAYVHKCRG
eukprot:gnl/MRDRNA2_/MRDRNA2_65863_c0_seq2.p1 gnl/MRDRNA2_/MRDRNA2_65863_c0~~gnl/MRDRNA2_/MRDRNA2_65863_c0_seq2.p1  ORF type:complete len:131 (+),score=20.13 gnl/MRDRNA2_/MRDRNA2_65863_c0_seq2:106-498(+)